MLGPSSTAYGKVLRHPSSRRTSRAPTTRMIRYRTVDGFVIVYPWRRLKPTRRFQGLVMFSQAAVPRQLDEETFVLESSRTVDSCRLPVGTREMVLFLSHSMLLEEDRLTWLIFLRGMDHKMLPWQREGEGKTGPYGMDQLRPDFCDAFRPDGDARHLLTHEEPSPSSLLDLRNDPDVERLMTKPPPAGREKDRSAFPGEVGGKNTMVDGVRLDLYQRLYKWMDAISYNKEFNMFVVAAAFKQVTLFTELFERLPYPIENIEAALHRLSFAILLGSSAYIDHRRMWQDNMINHIIDDETLISLVSNNLIMTQYGFQSLETQKVPLRERRPLNNYNNPLMMSQEMERITCNLLSAPQTLGLRIVYDLTRILIIPKKPLLSELNIQCLADLDSDDEQDQTTEEIAVILRKSTARLQQSYTVRLFIKILFRRKAATVVTRDGLAILFPEKGLERFSQDELHDDLLGPKYHDLLKSSVQPSLTLMECQWVVTECLMSLVLKSTESSRYSMGHLTQACFICAMVGLDRLHPEPFFASEVARETARLEAGETLCESCDALCYCNLLRLLSGGAEKAIMTREHIEMFLTMLHYEGNHDPLKFEDLLYILSLIRRAGSLRDNFNPVNMIHEDYRDKEEKLMKISQSLLPIYPTKKMTDTDDGLFSQMDLKLVQLALMNSWLTVVIGGSM